MRHNYERFALQKLRKKLKLGFSSVSLNGSVADLGT